MIEGGRRGGTGAAPRRGAAAAGRRAALYLALAACTPAAAAPALSVSPQRVDYGHPAHVAVQGGGAQRVLAPWQPRITARVPLPGPAYSLADGGRVVLTAGQGGLTLWDTAAGSASVLSHFAIDDTCTKVRVRGGTAYAACNDTGLWLVDITDPAAPARLADIATPVTDFAVGDGRLFVLSGVRLSAYDVSRAVHPIELAGLGIDAPVTGLGAAGDRVVVSEGSEGVALYRLGAQNMLAPAGRYRTIAAAGAVAVDGDLAYVALRGSGVVALRVTGPGAPQWVGSYHRLGQIVALRAAAGALYALNAGGVVYRLDDSRPDRLSIAAARRLAGGPRDLAPAAGDALWVLSDGALARVDFNGEVPPYSNETFDVGEGVNFGGIRRGVIVGDIAYVADWFSGIHLFDIHDPAHPHLISSFHTQGSPKGIVVRGGYAYVAADDHGLRIIDVHDAQHPRLVGSVITPGLAYTPVLDGQRLYLAGHRGGFQIIDVSDVTHPRILGGYATPGKAWSLQVRGNIAYVADDAVGLEVFDVHDPAHIRRLGGFDPGGDAEDVVLDGHYALVTYFDRGLYVVDVADPARPRAVAHLALPGNARGIELDGDTAYVADWLAGLHIVDIHDLRRPRVVGGYDTDGAAWGVRVRGRYAYVMDWWGGFAVLDVADARRPRLLARYHGRGRVHQVSGRGKFIFTACGSGGLQVFDVKNPLNPIWVTGIDDAGRITGLWRRGGTLFAVSDGGGLTVIDAADPYTVHAVGRLDLRLHRPLITGDGRGYLYISDPQQGIMVVDATDPAHPRRMAMIGSAAAALLASDHTLYVGTAGAIQAYDVTDPGRPIARAMLRTAGAVTALGGTGDALYAAVQGRGIVSVVLKGRALQARPAYPMDGTVSGIAAAAGRVLATQRGAGLWDFEAAPGGTLRPAAFYPVIHPATRIAVAGDTAYVAGGGTPTAIAWQRGVAWSAGGKDLALPAGLPRGDYEVMDLKDGDDATAALRVDFPPAGGRRFTMEDFQKALARIRARQSQGE